jgi:hypothetical protein
LGAKKALPIARGLRSAEAWRKEGHDVGELDFRIGNKPPDKFIDIAPFPYDWPQSTAPEWSGSVAHLKISIDGFASTSFGLIINKRD